MYDIKKKLDILKNKYSQKKKDQSLLEDFVYEVLNKTLLDKLDLKKEVLEIRENNGNIHIKFKNKIIANEAYLIKDEILEYLDSRGISVKSLRIS